METPPETEPAKPKTLGESLVAIGKSINELSGKEVENRKVVEALAVVGVAEVAILAGTAIKGEQALYIAQQLEQVGRNLNPDNFAAIGDVAAQTAEKFGVAIDNLSVARDVAYILAGQGVAVGVAEGVKGIKDPEKSFISNLRDGTTPVSTHIGPALGELFIKIGEHFSPKSDTSAPIIDPK